MVTLKFVISGGTEWGHFHRPFLWAILFCGSPTYTYVKIVFKFNHTGHFNHTILKFGGHKHTATNPHLSLIRQMRNIKQTYMANKAWGKFVFESYLTINKLNNSRM